MSKLGKRIQKIYETVRNEPRQRLVAILLLTGALLYLASGALSSEEKQEQNVVQMPVTEAEQQLEQQLEQFLRQMQGVGKVQVLLSLERMKSTVYQVDQSRSSSASGETVQENTVAVSGEAVVQTVYEPIYRGAVIVCQGGDRAAVVQSIKAVVRSLTGLKNDQITVTKMQ